MSDNTFPRNRKRIEEIVYTSSEIETHNNKLFNTLSKVTPDAFAEFMATRGASTTCISCGSSHLSVPENLTFDDGALPEDFGALPPMEQANLIQKAQHRYVTHYLIGNPSVALLSDFEFRVNCANCGHVSLYRAHPVVKWIEEQEEELSK